MLLSGLVAIVPRIMNDTTLPKPPPPPAGSCNPENSRLTQRAGNVHGRVVTVKKGFGLHDWMTLLRSAKDLAQRKGVPLRRDILHTEVKFHNKPYDGWIILRGKVYNVSPYLAYHPGGEEIMHSSLGKDATVLFDKYHQWVNIDSLIGPLLMGTLLVEKGEKRGSRSTILEDEQVDAEGSFEDSDSVHEDVVEDGKENPSGTLTI